MVDCIRIHEKDNVLVVLREVRAGECLKDEIAGEILAKNTIPMYHKIATQDIEKGEKVIKYGAPIGIATQRIERGDHVHIHNLDAVDIMGEDRGNS